MEFLKEIWKELSTLLKWWVIVLPWEQGVRVWLGKKVTILNAGFHFRVPHLHVVYVQPIRIEFMPLAPQTLTTKQGETFTVSVTIGYIVNDIQKLYNSVSGVRGTLSGFAIGHVSKYMTETIECVPSGLIQYVKDELCKSDWGIEVQQVQVITFAKIKAFRLIQDSQWTDNGHRLNEQK